MKKTIICSLVLFSICKSVAQDQFSVQLDELIIEKNKISNQSKSQHHFVLSDSLIDNANGSFTDFLQKNTTIYFKENGYGMVSSPSFRGTTAQQTGVLWNGIKVNSALLGQTDFNSTSFKNYDQIIVKPGGGSVLFGSGAMGGTIHLNNDFQFKKDSEHTVQLHYGSFKTMSTNYKFSAGTDQLAVNAHFGLNKSDNDYEWIGKGRRNSNGAFHNTHFGAEIAYRINSKNTLEAYSATYNDERHFSLLSEHQVRTKYQNNFYRNLVKWHYKTSRFLNSFYVANIQEDYKYFDQLPTENFSGGETSSWIVKNESFYQWTSDLRVSAFAEFQNTKGKGIHSNLPFATQQIFSFGALAHYHLTPKTGFEIGLKNERAKDYSDPLLFSAGWYYMSDTYDLKMNVSKNYRIPTFNDLYWQPGGNLQLNPETSHQFDINQEFKSKLININLSVYYSFINNMIRWVPTSTGYWEAENAGKVTVYGTELYLHGEKKFHNQQVSWNANYAFTQSTDQETNKQLTYTPQHKFNVQLSYRLNRFSISPSFMYIGKVYTTESNNEASALNSYGILSIDLQQKCSFKNKPLYINFKINNLTNTVYSSMPERLMPGRNYHLQIIKKF